MSETRYAKVRCMVVTLAGHRYEIPEIWLLGSSRTDRNAGMHPTEAYIRAAERWAEQGACDCGAGCP